MKILVKHSTLLSRKCIPVILLVTILFATHLDTIDAKFIQYRDTSIVIQNRLQYSSRLQTNLLFLHENHDANTINLDVIDESSSLLSALKQKTHSRALTLSSLQSSNERNKVLNIPRGGSLQTEESDDSILIQKVRNILRSLLEIGDRKIPTLSNIIRDTIVWMENAFKIKLISVPEKLPKKKKKKKRSVSSKDASTPELKTSKSSKSKVTSKASSIKNNEDKPTKTKTPSSNKNTSQTKPNSKNNTKHIQNQNHISRELKATNPNYRIQRELKAFITSPPPNLRVHVGKNIRVWIITVKGAANTIYENEKYRLRVSFPPNYPTVPPSMYFLHPTPRHEHVYTNGDICLSLLGKDWRPTMTAQSLAMSILSILSSAREKSLPMDNARHAVNKPGQPQDDWVYHDDNC